MAKILITGAGVTGLTAAALLARDGHSVTVVERDPAPPPAPARAWEEWERRGVGQFHQLHFLMPRWRAIVEDELPEVADALDRAGALRYNGVASAPPDLVGPMRPEDHEVTSLTARRPILESALASVAEASPGVEVRRGVAIAGLHTAAPLAEGVPHIRGLVTDEGERLAADLVVDATGRRSSLVRWLAETGARPPIEEEEDLGFVYYGRHFRSAEGSLPVRTGQLLQHYDSISILTLPADNGTWGVGVVTSSRDVAMRRLRDDETWERVVRSFPLAAHWVDAEPLDDVAVMAKLPDRYRRFVVDGVPVATGVVAVGDSWACTNPSLGRGIAMSAIHAVALRDLLRTGLADHPYKLALAWDDATEATVAPWYRTTLHTDRHRLAEIDAQVRGEVYQPDDPMFDLTKAVLRAADVDGEVWRGFLRFVGLLDTPEQMMAAPGFLDRVIAAGGDWRDAPLPGPGRDRLVDMVMR